MGKKDGMGYRVYPNGSVYMGNWENDFRHGVGTMTWPNGDIYRGEWVSGQMQGFVLFNEYSLIYNFKNQGDPINRGKSSWSFPVHNNSSMLKKF